MVLNFLSPESEIIDSLNKPNNYLGEISTFIDVHCDGYDKLSYFVCVFYFKDGVHIIDYGNKIKGGLDSIPIDLDYYFLKMYVDEVGTVIVLNNDFSEFILVHIIYSDFRFKTMMVHKSSSIYKKWLETINLNLID